jgi:hypothetical protein
MIGKHVVLKYFVILTKEHTIECSVTWKCMQVRGKEGKRKDVPVKVFF